MMPKWIFIKYLILFGLFLQMERQSGDFSPPVGDFMSQQFQPLICIFAKPST